VKLASALETSQNGDPELNNLMKNLFEKVKDELKPFGIREITKWEKFYKSKIESKHKLGKSKVEKVDEKPEVKQEVQSEDKVAKLKSKQDKN